MWQRSSSSSVYMHYSILLSLDSVAGRCVSRISTAEGIRGNWGRGCAVQSMSPRGITSHQRLVTELDWLVAVVSSSISSSKTTSFAGQVSCAPPPGDALFRHDGFLLVPESELRPYKLRYCPLQRTTGPPPPHQRARCWLGGPLLDTSIR